MEFPVYWFVSITFCPVTGYHWKKSGYVFSITSWHILIHMLIKSPWQVSKLSNLSPLWGHRHSNSLIVFPAISWTCSNTSMSLLYWEAQNRTQFQCALISSELTGSDHLPQSAVDTLNNAPHLFRVFCHIAGSCSACPPGNPGTPLQSCFPAIWPQIVRVHGAVPPHMPDFTLPFAKTSLFLQPAIALLAQPSGISTSLFKPVLSANLPEVHSAPSSMSRCDTVLAPVLTASACLAITNDLPPGELCATDTTIQTYPFSFKSTLLSTYLTCI